MLPEGLIPPQYQQFRHSVHRDDYHDLWVGKSHFFPTGGLALFFRVDHKGLKAGKVMGIYAGRDTNNTKLKYGEACRKWEHSDYVVADSLSRYVVDGHATCAAARANDGFTKFNLYLRYNRTSKRMEIILAGPMGPGIYEGLVNYDIPGQLPSYWTADRRALLHPSERQACEQYYCPQKTGQQPVTARRIMENKSRVRNAPRERVALDITKAAQKTPQPPHKVTQAPVRTIIQLLHVANRKAFEASETDNRTAKPPETPNTNTHT